MLNIPESIKALYLTDGRTDIRKNFRVTFPNGENPDITNENILTESVKFTESIMSQNVFRFGLAESPTISFETVGVPNILGMQIQCWHEIETSSLTAAQIATIEAGTWDGEYIPEEDSDIGFGYFRIPLGVFTVESCPRSKGAMTHRQVKAIGKSVGNNKSLDNVTRWKMAQWYESNQWGINWDFLVPSVYGQSWENVSPHYNESAVQPVETGGIYYSEDGFEIKFTSGTYVGLTYNPNVRVKEVRCSNYTNTLFRATLTGFTKEKFRLAVATAIPAVLEAMETEYGVDWTSSTTKDGEPLGDIVSCSNYLIDQIMEDISSLTPYFTADPTYFTLEEEYVRFGALFKNFDTVINSSVPDGAYSRIIVPYGIAYSDMTLSYRSGSNYETYRCPDITVPNVGPTFSALTIKPDEDINFPALALPTTLETKYAGVTYYGYSNSFSFHDLLTGFLELQGRFGRVKRDGSIELYTLTHTIAETITQSDVKELWWDESDVLPVGTVSVRFKTEKEESNAVIAIGKGPSTYDMTKNYILTKWQTTASAVSTSLKGRFKQNVTVLTWTPTDAEIRGLPYLEAGDFVQMQTGAADIPIVGVPLLERTLSGIQSLTDSISAVSGDVIEVTQ